MSDISVEIVNETKNDYYLHIKMPTGQVWHIMIPKGDAYFDPNPHKATGLNLVTYGHYE